MRHLLVVRVVNGADDRSARPPLGRLTWSLVVLGLLASALVVVVPRLADGVDLGGAGAPWGPECSVSTGSDEVGLTGEQAQRAATATVLETRGEAAPGVEDIDPAVLEALALGPIEDAGPVLTCRAEEPTDLAQQELTDTGLTPRAQRLREEMAEVFGEQSLGGFAPGGVGAGHGEESTHYDGRAVDVFYRPVTQESRREGWLLAQWLVAHAQDLDVQYVIFDDRYWGVRSSGRGWLDYEAPEPANEILRHLDHVHVDVLRGG